MFPVLTEVLKFESFWSCTITLRKTSFFGQSYKTIRCKSGSEVHSHMITNLNSLHEAYGTINDNYYWHDYRGIISIVVCIVSVRKSKDPTKKPEPHFPEPVIYLVT